MKEGAYGTHISSSVQSKLVGQFFNLMKKVELSRNSKFEYYKTTGAPTSDDTINSPCSLVIKNENNVTTIIDAHSFD